MPTDGNTDEVEVEGDINSIDDDSTPKFNPSTDMANPRFRLLMEFSNIKILKEAVRQYSIKNSRQIRYLKNDLRRIRVVCQEGCPFLLYASVLKDKQTF